MDQLKRQVAKARRRLLVQAFLRTVVWSCFATLAVAAAAIAVQKIWLVGIAGNLWAQYWFGGALAIGILAAAIRTLVRGRRDLDAAIELDRRFGLKERVSSCLAMRPDELHSPSGQALLADALSRVSQVDVAGRFRVTLARRAWLPLAPAAIALALCTLSDPKLSRQAAANTATATGQIQAATASLGHKLADQRQEAEKQGLKEAAELLKKTEQSTQSLSKNPPNQNQALAKLNDLTAELEQRRQGLAAGENLKQLLAQMKGVPAGPADKLAQDLKNARFDSAVRNLEALGKQLAKGGLDSRKQQALANQMAAMQQALQKTIDAHQRARRDLQRQLSNASKAGDQQQARTIQEQLSQLQRHQARIDRLADLARSLDGFASVNMQGNKPGEGQSALSPLASELGRLQREAAEAQLLDAALDQITDAKAAMNCQQCGGTGCAACQEDSGSDGVGSSPGGEGQRPDNPQGVSFYDAALQPDAENSGGNDGATVVRPADAPNAKGLVLENIKAQFEAAKSEPAEPVAAQRLPKPQREHLRQYFDALRKDR